MKGWNKRTVKRFNDIQDEKHLVFAISQKLRDNDVYFKEDRIFTNFMTSQEHSSDYLTYVIEKLFYCSCREIRQLDIYEVVDKYYDWFCYELSNDETIVSMLD